MNNTFLKKKLCLLLLVASLSSVVSCPLSSYQPRLDTTGLAAANLWADNKMKQMSLEDKVGQLMFVRVPLTMSKKQQADFEKNFSKLKVGGICFFKGTAQTQLERTKRYQGLSKIPLMVTIDGEWGLGMRLTDCYSFPRQMLMGALSPANDTLIERFGEEVGRQCRKMGINVNFAPVCDINSNPRNPVIGCRSFGENKVRVARKSAIYARSMQKKGIIAVGKHFPGHGDTDVDSHLDLPVINHPFHYIDSVDLFPFRRLVRDGIRGIMIAHLQVNALDNRLNMPSSLSERIVAPILRNDMGFDGLIFTDGIDMKAVSKNYKDGEGAIRAISAGCDVILLPIDVEKTIKAVLAEARRDPQFAKMVDDRCHRILREKHRSGLHKRDFSKLSVPTATDLHRCAEITHRMAQKALTLVHDEGGVLPLQAKDKVVCLAVGNCDTAVRVLSEPLRQQISDAGKVVISLFGNLGSSNNYGVSQESIDLVYSIASLKDVKSVLVIYGSPYILESFPNKRRTESGERKAESPDAKLPTAIVMAYQNMPEVVSAVDLALHGKTKMEGILPVSTGGYREGTSLRPENRERRAENGDLRDRFRNVRLAGMDVNCFKSIDSIALNGIAQKAYPGCQILVAKDGKIVYNRCYGKQTYDAMAIPMDTNTVYDLASLTKVSATNLAVMKLVDAGKISLDDRLSRYLPYLKHSNKSKITIRQALSHIARLKAFDSYWKESLNDEYLYWSGEQKAQNGERMADGYIAIGKGVYISSSFRTTMLNSIAKSDLERKEKYLYSDLGFILLADLVEHVSGQSLDIFMQKHFYGPMKLNSTCFRPLDNGISIDRIAPTEQDDTYRQQLIRGYVHDPNAAAMGGVAGHAGLFSTANDLFRLYQMMLDSGRFEGQRYISAKTFCTFNKRYYADKDNRRALGFDKPFIKGPSTHVSPLASQSSFGHTGFTGTMVWVDPQYNLIYIFLSNRVYPNAQPNKLANMNIRTDIQELIYKSLSR